MPDFCDGKRNGPGIEWPGFATIAVMITFDFDAEFLRLSRAKSKGKTAGFSDRSRGEYGPHEGLVRCLDVLNKHSVHSTFFIPGAVIEKYPDKVRSIHDQGHEIAYHGYNHETERGISKEQETDYMQKSESLISQITGKKPVGHRGPDWITHPFTPELLTERGYLYSSTLCDCDWAYLHEQNGRTLPLVELPLDVLMDDFTYYFFTYSNPVVRSMYANREVFDSWKDEFDALNTEKDKIFVLKLHPQLIGRGSRIAKLDQLIAYMKTQGAWITTCEQVARYVLDQSHTNLGA